MGLKGLILFRIIFILSYIFLSIIPTIASEETIFQARDEVAQKRVAITKLKIKLIDSELSNFSFNLKLFDRLSDPVQLEFQKRCPVYTTLTRSAPIEVENITVKSNKSRDVKK